MDGVTEGLTLTVPCERRFLGVVRLVVGGLSAALDLPYEQIDELQLAVENTLRESPSGGEVHLEFAVDGGAVAIYVGPLDARSLDRDLPDQAGGIGLQRVLAALVDDVDLLDRDGGRWIRLTKKVR